MLQIIGYILFIIITIASCMVAAVLGTITGIKQNESTVKNTPTWATLPIGERFA